MSSYLDTGMSLVFLYGVLESVDNLEQNSTKDYLSSKIKKLIDEVADEDAENRQMVIDKLVENIKGIQEEIGEEHE